MKVPISSPRIAVLFLLSLLALVAAGCSSVEPENTSMRPWNSPSGNASYGLPSSMMEGR